jgi:hypothetical protein
MLLDTGWLVLPIHDTSLAGEQNHCPKEIRLWLAASLGLVRLPELGQVILPALLVVLGLAGLFGRRRSNTA